MNFILIILLSFNNLIVYAELEESYSNLLGSIRIELIDEILLNLPKKENTNILLMCNTFAKSKVTYSLTGAESAFLAYKWICQNIDVEYNQNEQLEVTVYREGKANPKGMSKLFILFCSYLQVESKLISGYIKTANLKKIESYWNYIVINGNYYLVDTSFGAGYYNETIFLKYYSDLFFATKPEYFINYHYPHDNEYQFLSQSYSLENFDLYPFILYHFYLFGYKDLILRNTKQNEYNEIIFKVTFENYFDFDIFAIDSNLKRQKAACNKYLDWDDKYIKLECKVANKDVFYLEITFSPPKNKYLSIILFNLNSTTKKD